MITVNIDGEDTEVVFDKKEKKRKNRIKQKIVSATPLIVTAIYLLLGFCFKADISHLSFTLAMPCSDKSNASTW